MALIYVLVTAVGAQSRGVFEAASNGGEALSQIAGYYFGTAGALILAATVTVACLKTAVGLITSCGKTFVKLFPGGPSYPVWAVGFCVLSFLIANLGLDAIIAYTVPVLMFLYSSAAAGACISGPSDLRLWGQCATPCASFRRWSAIRHL